MPKLMPPVHVGGGNVSLHFSLPGRYLGQMSETARDTQTPRSDLLGAFLDQSWCEFRRGHLMEGLTHLQNQFGFLGRLVPPGPDVSEWLRELIDGSRMGDRNVVLVTFVSADWWRRLAEDLREVEREFMSASLSDVVMLFFAWGWARFEMEWRQGRGAPR